MPGLRTPEKAHGWQRRDATTGTPPQRPPWNGALAATGPSTGRGRPLTASTRRMYARRRRSMLLVFLLVAGIVLWVGQALRNDGDPAPTAVTIPPSPAAAAPAGSPSVSAKPKPPPKPPSKPTATSNSNSNSNSTGSSTAGRQAVATSPSASAGRSAGAGPTLPASAFTFASTAGPVLGTTGSLRRFTVAVENGVSLDAGDFAGDVDRILGDPRSWIAAKQYRLQRVAQGTSSEFTIFLASAATSERMCAAGGLQTARYTSCRLGGEVIMNLDRWTKAVPDYGAPLATYQAYALNHEVGHQLGHGHEACSGKGAKAPVMQQQTYGLKGCTANAWPYVDGKRYAGEPIE